ncbi:MAG: uracil-DNA glycosylase family protein [Sphingobacteriia bacterium]|nr:uracil-DNA glycosylase family protein [Sphingobacteriia bacterium]
MKLEELKEQIATYVENDPLAPKGSYPILQISTSAKLLIIGQAPGVRAQVSGLPFNDASGNRLRSWLNISREQFYDKNLVAIVPMGFCYPGPDKYGYDKAPNIQHAKLWHKLLFDLMPNIELTLLVGGYSQKYYLGNKAKATMTETLHYWREYLPKYIVLPHPSWRNTGWLNKHTWFEKELIPELRKRVQKALSI